MIAGKHFIEVTRNLLKLKLCNSEIHFSILAFLTQLRGGLRELILVDNIFTGIDSDILHLEIDNDGTTIVTADNSDEESK